MPKVSIVMPTFNCSEYICNAIESVLAQQHSDYEIIVVDDGSTDNTKDVLEPYSNKIRYFYQQNRGPSAARNLGIHEAKGEVIAFLDSDDMWLKGYLNKCFDLITSHEYDLVMTDNYTDIYDDKQLIKREYRDRENYLENKDRLYEVLFERFVGGFSGDVRILIRKSCFDRIGYFDESLKIMEDWDLWMRIAKQKLRVGYIQEPLFIYRRHSHALCRAKDITSQRNKLRNIYRAFKKHKEDACKINRGLKETYSRTLQILGRESIANRIDLPFGAKCIAESLFCRLH